MSSKQIPVDFTLGSRRLFAVRRRLVTLAFSLDEALAGEWPELPALKDEDDGYRVLSAPAPLGLPNGRVAGRDLICGGRQDYPRHYIDMNQSFADYMARFSGKTRSTLRRKSRKLESESGATLELCTFASPAEIEAFMDEALVLSARTYQARLLGAGLPDSAADRAHFTRLAGEDRLRCFLLRARGKAIAYLALPVEERTLVYAHLGYDPDWARFSPGTVLQFKALESLFAEARFERFDFTEGDGAHKALFATDSVRCASFLLLRPTLANRALLAARDGFDGAVAAAKARSASSASLARMRKLLRS